MELLFDGSGLYVVHSRKAFNKVGIAFGLDLALVGSPARGRTFAVTAVQFVDHIHSGKDSPERREALRIQAGIVPDIDEQLRGSRIGAGVREGNVASLVAFLDRIIGNPPPAPGCRHGGISMNTELNHESGDHPEK